MSHLLNLYYKLPAPGRTLAASLRGYYLRSWRYGRDTERIARAAIDRERWSADQWRQYESAALAQLLHRAATKVPFYREHWAQRRRQGDQSSPERLENWPIIEKDDVRKDPRAFVADDCNPDKMFRVRTSGTTGKPIDLWFSRRTHTDYYGIAEARGRYWYDVSRHDPWGIQGAHLVVRAEAKRPPYWVWNSAFKQLYLSAFHMTHDRIDDYLDAMERYRVVYLHAYPQYLYVMAKTMLQMGRRFDRLKVIIANAEPLLDYQRKTINDAFGCPVRETWGMSEIVGAAGECEHERLHLWPEVGKIEVMCDGKICPENRSGELVCTGLLNRDMPLIRYRVGDCGTLGTDQVCQCGRTLPILQSLDGRTTDLVYLPDGRMINRFEPVFITELPLIEAQIIQDSLAQLRILYVPTPEFTPQHESMMIQRTRDRMGNPAMNIVAEATNQIPRTKSGKFRSVVCNLSPQEREAIERGIVAQR